MSAQLIIGLGAVAAGAIALNYGKVIVPTYDENEVRECHAKELKFAAGNHGVADVRAASNCPVVGAPQFLSISFDWIGGVGHGRVEQALKSYVSKLWSDFKS